MKALTLFNLKEDKEIAAYKAWSLKEVHPRMMRMPSVLEFRDYEVTGTMGGNAAPYQLVEEIVITSPEEFERDNAEGDGAVLAAEWQQWVADFVVIYCDEIS